MCSEYANEMQGSKTPCGYNLAQLYFTWISYFHKLNQMVLKSD